MAEIPTPDLAVPYLSNELYSLSIRTLSLRGTDAGEDDGGGTTHCTEEWGVDGTKLSGGRHLDLMCLLMG
jgi:hypothetical protein